MSTLTHPDSAILRLMSDSTESVSELTQSLSPEYEMFAVMVANGSTMREAASLAGFAEGYCTQLGQRPEVRARIEYLLDLQRKESEVFGGIASRAWIEAQLVIIARQAMMDRPAKLSDDGKTLDAGRPADMDLARRTLMDLAKLKGMVIERKQVANARISLDAGGSVLEGQVSSYLDSLDPGARREILSRVQSIEARRKGKRRLTAPAADQVVTAVAPAGDSDILDTEIVEAGDSCASATDSTE